MTEQYSLRERERKRERDRERDREIERDRDREREREKNSHGEVELPPYPDVNFIGLSASFPWISYLPRCPLISASTAFGHR